jgi:hypothetical protein
VPKAYNEASKAPLLAVCPKRKEKKKSSLPFKLIEFGTQPSNLIAV